MEEARINPIKITDKIDGTVYTLDFSRDSVRFAEQHAFELDDVPRYPVIKFPEFFYYALRKNHRGLSRTQSDALYERLGGFSEEFLKRLSDLYNQAALSNNIVETNEDMGKNGQMAVEL